VGSRKDEIRVQYPGGATYHVKASTLQLKKLNGAAGASDNPAIWKTLDAFAHIALEEKGRKEAKQKAKKPGGVPVSRCC
jgi:hypothetical protein